MRIYLHPQKNYAVSVIIPLYNAERYIAECLDSLLIQTFQDFEVIVVDDCSTDKSVNIVEDYVSKFNGRLTLTKTEKNSGGGGYVPRNMGLNLAQGKYIQFLDADDFLLGSALETLYNSAEEYNADVVHIGSYYRLNKPNYIYLHRDGISKKLLKESTEDKTNLIVDDPNENLSRLLFRGEYFHTPWSKFILREFLLEHEIIFPEIVTGGDFIWIINVYCHAKKFLRISTPLYFYRRYNTKSITHPKGKASEQILYTFNNFITWLKALYELINKTDILRENPIYSYEAFSSDFKYRLSYISEILKELSTQEIYEILYNKFAQDHSDYTLLLSSFLFSFIDNEKKILKNYVEIINKFKPYFTARVEAKLIPKGEGDFEIVSVSDEKVDVRKPAWLQWNGIGYQIQSYVGNMKIVGKTTVDGKIQLVLRGLDIREPEDNSKRIPYWIDYTKLNVNDKVIFDKLTPTWHDKPYRYSMDVKAGEEITIQAEWLPHRDDRFNVSKLVPTIQTEPTIDKKFLPYLTSRLDVIMMSEGDLQIVSTSDNKAKVAKAHWLPKNESGCFVQSCVGKMEVFAKASADSQIQLLLRGMDIRNPGDKSKRIPYWIDYTKFTVNGKVIFDELKPTCHDKPYSYTLDVKADEEIKVQTEWQPHRDDRFDVSTAVAIKQETPKKNAQTIQESKNHLTARIDVILEPTEQGDFQILSVSDDKALIRKAHWLAANKIGYFVHSYAGKMEIIIKVIGGGQFNLDLRGIDIRDPEDKSKRIPYWIDYTKLNVNGEVIFDEITPVWHDKPFRYNIDAKDGEEIIISVEWQPHRSDT